VNTVADRYVYAINDEFGKPCYVGVGRGRRLNDHVRDARYKKGTSNPAKLKFFIDCLERGFEPQAYKVAEGLSIDEANNYERTLIAWYGRRDLGTGNLLNANAGGTSSKDYSKSTIARISKATKDAMKDPKVRAKITANRRPVVHTAETKAKISIGVLATLEAHPEIRIKISEKGKGKKKSKKSRALMSVKAFERWANPEFHAKLCEIAGERMRTPEARAAQSKRMTGHKHSRKTRAKILASQRARRAREKITGNAHKHSLETRAKMVVAWNIRRARKQTSKQNSSEVGTPA